MMSFAATSICAGVAQGCGVRGCAGSRYLGACREAENRGLHNEIVSNPGRGRPGPAIAECQRAPWAFFGARSEGLVPELGDPPG
jgi:hypothetical protein